MSKSGDLKVVITYEVETGSKDDDIQGHNFAVLQEDTVQDDPFDRLPREVHVRTVQRLEVAGIDDDPFAARSCDRV